MAHLDFIKKITSLHLLLFAELSSSQTIPGNGLPNKKKTSITFRQFIQTENNCSQPGKVFLECYCLVFQIDSFICDFIACF